MTVKDKTLELNKQFQVSYFDTDLGFFSYTAPDMINQIKIFLTSVINEQHPLRHSVSKQIELLDKQLEDLKAVANNSSANHWVKDKWLIGFKQNVVHACNSFIQDCWSYDANILTQVV